MRTGLILSLILNCVFAWQKVNAMNIPIAENGYYFYPIVLSIGTILLIIVTICEEIEE